MDNFLQEYTKELEKLIEIFNFFSNNKIRTEKISVEMLEDVEIDDKKTKKKVKNIADISLIDSGKKILIKPYEKKNSSIIIKEILNAELGYSLLENDERGLSFIASPLTTDIKKKMIDKLSNYCEKIKIQMRQIRHKYNNKIKKEDMDELTKKFQEKLNDKKMKKIKQLS